jgi:lantibiotic transport system ATP-binding protein
MAVIQINNLSHQYTPVAKEIDGLTLTVEEGAIYGFLGPNGAGKTTTLRLILGLLPVQQGNISIFGQSLAQDRINILRWVGSLIESPSIYGHLTAGENLTVWQKIYRCSPNRINYTLQQVGLGEVGKKKAGQFSLGMKQRLGIAIALLHQPALLILDEPTNGLDPNGMVEIRDLLHQLNRQEGITILISSHLLAEIEKLATHVGIINRGKIVFEGRLETLLHRQQQANTVVFDTDKPHDALTLIAHHHAEAELSDGRVSVGPLTPDAIHHLNVTLTQAGIQVFGIVSQKPDLEGIFMDLIS